MYGNDPDNPLVKYYDQTFAVTSSGDIAWFVDQAKASGGPVLDLACGTGRIALALAQAGLEVAAIDSSSAMLRRFQDRLVAQSPAIRSRIRIYEAGMHAFDVPGVFSTVICCDAFFHNLTADDQISCLRCVASHLAPRGHFVFNIPNPTIGFLSYAASPEAQEFRKRDEYPLDNSSDTVLVEQAQYTDLFEQTITTRLRFTRLDTARDVVESGESSWITRYTFRYEAIHLLYRCGFEVVSLTGNYKGAPVAEDSQLVFVARWTGK
jgi:SAM-dependent methyltransferase